MFPVVLRREVLIALAVKVGLLVLLYFLFFSPAHRPPQTPLRDHLTGEG